MPLSENQRRHPHRAVNPNRPQTYLGRSFSDADAEAMETWWADGVVARVLNDPKRRNSFMRSAVSGLPLLPPATRQVWWERLWTAGARTMTDEHPGWLSQLLYKPEAAEFLVQAGVSGFSHHPNHGTLAADALHRVQQHRVLSPRNPPSAEHHERSERLWQQAERLWMQPGATPKQVSEGLGALTRLALTTSHPNDVHWPRLCRLRDHLLGATPDPWADPFGSGLLHQWLASLPRNPPRGSTDGLYEAAWVQWGQSLLARRPLSPRSARPDRGLIESIGWPLLTPFLEPLAHWGITPWLVRHETRTPDGEKEPHCFFEELAGHRRRAGENQPLFALPAPLLQALDGVARLHPPAPDLQGALVQAWLHHTLRERPAAFSLTATNPHVESWMSSWEQWGAWGRWMDTGAPADVVTAVRQHAGHLAVLDPPILARLMPLLRAFRIVPDALVPPLRTASRLAPDSDPARHSYLWDSAASSSWAWWQRLYATPELQDEALRLLPEEPGLLHAAAALTGESTAEQQAFVRRLAREQPQWLPAQGDGLLLQSVRNGNAAIVRLLLELGVAPPADWSAWEAGVRATGCFFQPGKDNHTPIALALHQAGLQWEAGDPAHWPLYQVVLRASVLSGERAVDALLGAGADPLPTAQALQKRADAGLARETPTRQRFAEAVEKRRAEHAHGALTALLDPPAPTKRFRL